MTIAARAQSDSPPSGRYSIAPREARNLASGPAQRNRVRRMGRILDDCMKPAAGRGGERETEEEMALYGASLDMWGTCFYTGNMSKMIQVRDVPGEVHRTLKARAAQEGMSLSGFIKRELERTAAKPDMREWLARTAQSRPLARSRSAAAIVRELRESR